jgi:hypothetical protein
MTASKNELDLLQQQQEQGSRIAIRQVGHEVWSIECLVDELQLILCKVVEHITFTIENDGWGQSKTKTLTVHKYYRQARELMKWIPVAKPPEFVINASDLSPKIIEELEDRVDHLPTLRYIFKEAVGRIFENLDFDRYHLTIARNLRVRIDP